MRQNRSIPAAHRLRSLTKQIVDALERPIFWICAGLALTLILLGFQDLQFGRPINFIRDHVFYLKVTKEMIDGMFRFNSKLGAPAFYDNFYYPLFDFSYKALSWVLGKFTPNIFTVIAWLYLVGVTFIYLFSFWSFRMLAFPPFLSCIASVAFTVSPYFASRSFDHDYLSLYYSVPLGAAIPLVMATAQTREELLQRLSNPHFIISILVVGTSGVYYGFFSSVFVILGMTMLSAEQRRWTPLLIGIGSAAAIILLLIVTTYGPWAVGLISGSTTSPPPRGGAVVQLVEGLLLSTAMGDYYNLGLWTENFSAYLRALALPFLTPTQSESFKAEWPGPLLTTTILASLVLAPLVAFARPRPFQRSSILISMSILLIAFGVVFSLRGGLGFVFNFMIMDGIRSQERVLPFLTFYALVILCVLIQSLAARHLWIARIATCIFTVCLIPGLKPAFQIVATKQARSLHNTRIIEESIYPLLAAKNAAGLQSVLQMPAVPSIENDRINAFGSLQHFVPYLLDSHGSQTRWSHGLSSLQKEAHQLVDVTRVDNPELATRAVEMHYDGILIEKVAYTPADLTTLESRLASANGVCRIYNDVYRELFALGKPCID